MGFLDKYSKEDVQAFVNDSKSFAEVLIKMGRSANSGSNRMVVAQYTKDQQIDTSHFEAEARNRTPQDIFIENSTATQSTMRKYYKRGNYSEYKCAICGQEPFWNGKELVLTLDHINGINNDHRLANLRWICPNCDRQLPTYGSKRNKQIHRCSNCGLEIARENKSGLCKVCYTEHILKNPDSHVNKRKVKHGKYAGTRSDGTCKLCGTAISKTAKYCAQCYAKTKMKAERPSAVDLAKMVKDTSFVAVGKQFGVSDRAVQKWCQDYQIPHTRKELIAWYNKQVGIVEESQKKAPQKRKDEIVRPVKQIDKVTGEVLNVFPTQADALCYLGKRLDDNHIGQVCRGLRKSAYGYFWQYA